MEAVSSVEVSKQLHAQWQKVKASKTIGEEITEWQKCCALVDLKEAIVKRAVEDAKRYAL